MGGEFLDDVSSRLGIDRETATAAASELLPDVIKHFAPEGKLPTIHEVVDNKVAAEHSAADMTLTSADHTKTNGFIAKIALLLGAPAFLAACAWQISTKPVVMDGHPSGEAHHASGPKKEVKRVEPSDKVLPQLGRVDSGPQGETTPEASVVESTPAAPSEEAGQKAIDALEAKTEVTGEELVSALNLCIIKFDTANASISPASDALLNDAANVIKKAQAGTKIEVGGHTDNVGNADKNIQLSLARATAVRDRLVKLGCNAEMFVPKGFGDTKPAADNATEEGRTKNRRMEFKLLGG
jgi:outer membrane protein OmpA-like peptidoglycan-associated protein